MDNFQKSVLDRLDHIETKLEEQKMKSVEKRGTIEIWGSHLRLAQKLFEANYRRSVL